MSAAVKFISLKFNKTFYYLLIHKFDYVGHFDMLLVWATLMYHSNLHKFHVVLTCPHSSNRSNNHIPSWSFGIRQQKEWDKVGSSNLSVMGSFIGFILHGLHRF